MDKIFTEMFSRQPDEIISGDYFYHLPYYEKRSEELRQMVNGIPLEKSHEVLERNMKTGFKYNWLCGEDNPFLCNPYFIDILNTYEDTIHAIARDGKPFMDIASSETMGLAPDVIKLNPQIPCLVTDINAFIMKKLRLCTDENLLGYNINIASFDNYDMPLKDAALDYITSRYGVMSSSSKSDHYQYSVGAEKVIDEIYRILKPGGRFIALEKNRECYYDLRELDNEYNEHGKIYGVYTYDEMQAVCGLLTDEPWRDKFTAAGFEIEVEENFHKECSLHDVMHFLNDFTDYHGIHQRKKINWSEPRHTENTGFDLYETDTFFVLKKLE